MDVRMCVFVRVYVRVYAVVYAVDGYRWVYVWVWVYVVFVVVFRPLCVAVEVSLGESQKSIIWRVRVCLEW